MYVEILSTFNQADIAWIKHVLDREEITYHLQGENFNLVEPLVQPVKLLVGEDQVERVKELLKDSKLS